MQQLDNKIIDSLAKLEKAGIEKTKSLILRLLIRIGRKFPRITSIKLLVDNRNSNKSQIGNKPICQLSFMLNNYFMALSSPFF